MTASPTNEPKSGYGVSVIVALLIIIGLGGWFAYYVSNTQPLVDDTLRDQFTWHIAPAQPLPDVKGPAHGRHAPDSRRYPAGGHLCGQLHAYR